MSDQNKCPYCGIDVEALKKVVMDAVMSMFNSSMNEMRRQHSTEIQEMRREHSVIIQDMRREHSLTIQEVRREHSAEIQLLKQQVSELVNDNFRSLSQNQEGLEEAKKTHASELNSMRFTADSNNVTRMLENVNEVLRTAHIDLTVRVENLTTQVANLTALVKVLENENAEVRMAINRGCGVGA